MEKMTREQVLAWKAQWKAMEEFHAQELREMSTERRLALTRAGFRPHRRTAGEEAGLARVRERWLTLKRRHLA
jgi:hypothetical protein